MVRDGWGKPEAVRLSNGIILAVTRSPAPPYRGTTNMLEVEPGVVGLIHAQELAVHAGRTRLEYMTIDAKVPPIAGEVTPEEPSRPTNRRQLPK